MSYMTPSELSHAEFTKAIRGYQPAEVDAYIEKLTESYTALFNENKELSRRLFDAEQQVALAQAKENDIQRTLETARKASDAVMEEAYNTSDRVLSSVRSGCDAILGEFREKIEDRQRELRELKAAVEGFKTQLMNAYRQHLELIDSLSPDAVAEPEVSSDEYVSRIVYGMKQEMLKQSDIAMETISSEECLKKPAEESVSEEL